MNSTREQIVIERKATNIPPRLQITTSRTAWYDATHTIKGKRKHLLEQARLLAKGN